MIKALLLIALARFLCLMSCPDGQTCRCGCGLCKSRHQEHCCNHGSGCHMCEFK